MKHIVDNLVPQALRAPRAQASADDRGDRVLQHVVQVTQKTEKLKNVPEKCFERVLQKSMEQIADIPSDNTRTTSSTKILSNVLLLVKRIIELSPIFF